jgi:hypothetical protein
MNFRDEIIDRSGLNDSDDLILKEMIDVFKGSPYEKVLEEGLNKGTMKKVLNSEITLGKKGAPPDAKYINKLIDILQNSLRSAHLIKPDTMADLAEMRRIVKDIETTNEEIAKEKAAYDNAEQIAMQAEENANRLRIASFNSHGSTTAAATATAAEADAKARRRTAIAAKKKFDGILSSKKAYMETGRRNIEGLYQPIAKKIMKKGITLPKAAAAIGLAAAALTGFNTYQGSNYDASNHGATGAKYQTIATRSVESKFGSSAQNLEAALKMQNERHNISQKVALDAINRYQDVLKKLKPADVTTQGYLSEVQKIINNMQKEVTRNNITAENFASVFSKNKEDFNATLKELFTQQKEINRKDEGANEARDMNIANLEQATKDLQSQIPDFIDDVSFQNVSSKEASKTAMKAIDQNTAGDKFVKILETAKGIDSALARGHKRGLIGLFSANLNHGLNQKDKAYKQIADQANKDFLLMIDNMTNSSADVLKKRLIDAGLMDRNEDLILTGVSQAAANKSVKTKVIKESFKYFKY